VSADGGLEAADMTGLAATRRRPEAAAPVSPEGLALSIHADLGEVEAVWRGFEPRAIRTPFQSFDWLATWQSQIGALTGVTPAIVIGRDPGSGIIQFIFPMAVEGRGMMRRLTFLGADLCDYNAPLFAAEFAATLTPPAFLRLWSAITRRLRADPRFGFDLYDLRKMPETLGGTRNPLLALRVRLNPSRAYATTLGNEWDAYYAERRSAATRKTERKQAKRLAEQGEVAFLEPPDAGGRAATIDALIAQKRRALARMGADDIFDRPGHLGFYRAIARNPKLTDLVHVSRLDVGQEMGAASVALSHRGTYSLVLSSYHDGSLAQHGPGRAHLHALMRRAIAAKYTVFDFTIGDEPYKRDWCDRELALHDHLAAASVRAAPIAAMIVAARAAKRTIKQTPVLWRAFTRLRAIAGKSRR
jgi:CelD/BcsL family acetyltransferase involved in cellulose biosynthesis